MNSLERSSSQYSYNFEHSLANYQTLEPEQDPSNVIFLDQFGMTDELLILQKSNELILFGCFKNPQTEQIAQTLFTHLIQFYGRIALRLFRINVYTNQLKSPTYCATSSSYSSIYSENGVSKTQQLEDGLETERQKLISCLQELTVKVGNEKQKYLKLISLIVASVAYKIMCFHRDTEDDEDSIEFEMVFHEIYWELSGQHSTSQMLKELLSDTYHMKNFDSFLTTFEPQSQTSICQQSVNLGQAYDENDALMPPTKLSFDHELIEQRPSNYEKQNQHNPMKMSFKSLLQAKQHCYSQKQKLRSQICNSKNELSFSNRGTNRRDQKGFVDKENVQNSLNHNTINQSFKAPKVFEQITTKEASQANKMPQHPNTDLRNNFKKQQKRNCYFETILKSNKKSQGVFSSKLMEQQLQKASNLSRPTFTNIQGSVSNRRAILKVESFK